MSLVGFRASNHPQQVGRNGADDEIDDRGTPQEFWDGLDAKYGFTLDVAAAPHNAKTERYYTRADDGLVQPWTGSVWCNPPYSDLNAWIAKAWTEWWSRRDELHSIVMLLPANRPEQPWWQKGVEPYRDRADGDLTVRFLPGRLRFIMPGATEVKPNERPPFGCCLLVWSRSVAVEDECSTTCTRRICEWCPGQDRFEATAQWLYNAVIARQNKVPASDVEPWDGLTKDQRNGWRGWATELLALVNGTTSGGAA